MSDFDTWLATRPPVIQKLARRFPPGSIVTSRRDRPCMIPAPGIEGEVYSYFENGTVGVVAPMATSPITGAAIERGEFVTGQCDPDRLVLLASPTPKEER